MGVSGSGKSTVARQLATALQVQFLECDELHSAQNVARMAAGIALTDTDRREWLALIAQRMVQARLAGRGLVVACSALKRIYRDSLRHAVPDLILVYLGGSGDLLHQRTLQRQGHYMPVSLLPSQLATLEPPQADERALCFDVQLSVQSIVQSVVQSMAATAVSPGAT